MEGDKVVAYGADVKACALGQASSSIMAQHVIGLDGRRNFTRSGPAMRPHVEGRWRAPRAKIYGGKWKDLEVLETRPRLQGPAMLSTLLIFDCGRGGLWMAAMATKQGQSAAQ